MQAAIAVRSFFRLPPLNRACTNKFGYETFCITLKAGLRQDQPRQVQQPAVGCQ